MAEGSKNNPENRVGNTNADKWTLLVEPGKKKKYCKVVGNKLVDKQGNVVSSY